MPYSVISFFLFFLNFIEEQTSDNSQDNSIHPNWHNYLLHIFPPIATLFFNPFTKHLQKVTFAKTIWCTNFNQLLKIIINILKDAL